MKNIYLADDDEDDTEIFQQVVAEVCPGAEITCSSDGFSLMQSLDKNVPPPPDVIFLDINMPLMDGHEAIANIKKQKAYRDVPVVIYSTSKAVKDIDAMYEAGADLFICKPPDYKSVKDVIRLICNIDFKTDYKRPSRDGFLIAALDKPAE